MKSISCSVICVRGTTPHLAGCPAVRCMVSFAVRVRFPRVPLKNAMALRMGTPLQRGAGPDFDCVQRSFCARIREMKMASFWQFRRLVGRPFFECGALGGAVFCGLERGKGLLLGRGTLAEGDSFRANFFCWGLPLWAAGRLPFFRE